MGTEVYLGNQKEICDEHQSMIVRRFKSTFEEDSIHDKLQINPLCALFM